MSRTYVEDHMKESLKNHVLVPLLHSNVGEVRGFYLKPPGRTRMMSTLILFSPEGIVLQGDLTPSHHGDVSSYGYGAQWFGGRLSEDYLCEKFLQKEFVPEKAYATFKERILSRRREGDQYMTKEKAREAYDANEEHGPGYEAWDSREFYDCFCGEFGFDYDGDGYGYNLAAAGWLCAIQQKFAELYQVHLTGQGITPIP